MYIHYSLDPEDEFITYEYDWPIYLDKDLAYFRAFDKRARFHLYMDQNSPFSEFEKFTDVFRRHRIYTVNYMVFDESP